MKAVCYMATRDYYEKVTPSIVSMIIHGNVDRIYCLIEDDTFPYDLPVEFINVGDQKFFDPHGPNYHSHWSHMVLMRAALHRLFDLDRILSVDADTIVMGDISGIWDINLTAYYLAAAREPHHSLGGMDYIQNVYVNMGVSFFNLDKLRDGTGDRIIHRLNTEPFKIIEQDAINFTCKGHILEMPSKYNACRFTEPTSEKLIYHFAMEKDWFDYPLVYNFRYDNWKGVLCQNRTK